MIDDHAATDLELYINNTAELYPQLSSIHSAWFALWPGRGKVSDQQILKIAGTDEMDSWLRETYGSQYGRAGGRRAHATRKAHQQLHEPGALRSASDRQLRGFYKDEKHDADKARAEAKRRGLSLHARKSPGQLDREIAEHVQSWRRGR